jgi:hypothetical protein
MSILIMGRMSSLIVVLLVLTLDVRHKVLDLLGEGVQVLGEGVQALVEGVHALFHVLRHVGYLSVQLFQVLSMGGRGHCGGLGRMIPQRSTQDKESVGIGGK